jgi:hypothetical protein
MDEFTTYEDQLDPGLLARVEAWRKEQNERYRIPDDEPDGHAPASSYDLMREARAEGRKGLSTIQASAAIGFEAWHVADNARTGFPPGRPTAWPSGAPEDVLERLRQSVGVDRAEFSRLVRRGRKPEADRWPRAALEWNISVAVQRGEDLGITRHLADAYGCSKGTISKLAARGFELRKLVHTMGRTPTETKP